MGVWDFPLRIRFAVPLIFAAAAACSGPCPRIIQTVYVASPDESLQDLAESCVSRSDARCSEGQRNCRCLPLCQRVLELVDGFKGNETLESCHATAYGPSTDEEEGSTPAPFRNAALVVELTYTPSSCDEPAR